MDSSLGWCVWEGADEGLLDTTRLGEGSPRQNKTDQEHDLSCALTGPGTESVSAEDGGHKARMVVASLMSREKDHHIEPQALC